MDADKIKMFDDLSENGKAEVLKRLELENMKEETINRMKTDPGIQEFFEKFHPNSLDLFIKIYAKKKEHWMVSGDSFALHNFNFDHKYRDEATKGLRMILLKKLLIKICEWSAGLIELEGIKISDDFRYWEANIFNCPFLEQVTEEELNIYMKYLNGPDYEKYDIIYIPDSYNYVRPDYNSIRDDMMPEFSILYDTLKGTSGKWLLPNIRCAKEQKYKNAFQEERVRLIHKDIEDGKIIAPKIDKRPQLHHSDEKVIEGFIRKFETPQLLQQYRSTKKFGDDHCNYDDDEYKIHIPEEDIQESSDAAMRNVYEDYLFRKGNGISFEEDEAEIKRGEHGREYGRKEITEGRILLGEPGNLDIY
jgi:hypothetical protein